MSKISVVAKIVTEVSFESEDDFMAYLKLPELNQVTGFGKELYDSWKNEAVLEVETPRPSIGAVTKSFIHVETDRPKIYDFDGMEWIVARSLEEAIDCLDGYTGCADEYDREDITVLSDEKWDQFKYRADEEGTIEMTFRERVKQAIESGEETVPFHLAASEY